MKHKLNPIYLSLVLTGCSFLPSHPANEGLELAANQIIAEYNIFYRQKIPPAPSIYAYEASSGRTGYTARFGCSAAWLEIEVSRRQEAIIKTLRHELAHYINFYLNGCQASQHSVEWNHIFWQLNNLKAPPLLLNKEQHK